MIYTIDNVGMMYTGTGDTLRLAIADALTQLAAVHFANLAQARAWCIGYIRQEASRRKSVIFSAAKNYDPVELTEMIAEARDYKISGNATAARYPLASALATALGVQHTTLLTNWGSALQTAFGQLATLIDRQDRAETLINGAASMAALRDAMGQ